MQIKDIFKVIQADITQLDCDAIVNAANNRLLMGGGVAGVIRRKGGAIIEDEAVAKGPMAVGGATWTKAGKLPCQYVIHAVTMAMDFKTDSAIIRQATAAALEVAEELKIASIAFPALGCGVGGFPLEEAAQIMKTVSKAHLNSHSSTALRGIIFCLYDKQAYNIYEHVIYGTR